MSGGKTNQRNIFLKSSNNHFSRSTFDHKESQPDESVEANNWLEKFKPTLQCINKDTLKTTLPRFVQDYICKTWQKKMIGEVEEFEKPKKGKSGGGAARWDQIKSEMFEREEIKKQDNTFKNSNHYQERSFSRFRPNSYKPKPKKEPIFDLAKETERNSFPDLN